MTVTSGGRQAAHANDVCIVGAGIMGLMSAYYLVQSGRCATITLIEEGEPAGGASGKAAGFLAKRWHGAPTSSLGVLSFELHAGLARDLDGAQRYGYRTMPTVSMNVQKGKGTRSRDVREDPILNWLDAANVSNVEVMDDDSGTAQVHPLYFCQAILEQCREAGVKVIRGRAEKAKRRGRIGGWQVEVRQGESTQTSVEADKLIIAAGPWTAQVAKTLLDVEVSIGDLPGHSLVIKTKDPIPAVAIFASVHDRSGKVTTSPELFTRPDGTVYVAGENSGAPLPPGSSMVTQSQPSLDRLAAVCRLISPRLDITNPETVQSFGTALCYRPVSSRGYPILGPIPGLDQEAFVVAGHGPWGISLGPGSGKVMSEIVLDGRATSANVDYLQI